MNKKILNEINEMKYLFGYKRGVVISEQVSEPEQRARDAYKLMIDGAAGWGTDPKKIRAGMDTLTTADEFYRMNSLFKDKKTGYESFEEMFKGELEFGGIGSNVYTAKYISSKLDSLTVQYRYRTQNDSSFYLKNVKTIDQPLVSPAPVTPEAPAAAAKTPATVVDNWEDVKKYYKVNQDVDPQPDENDTETWQNITVTGNGRTYILRSLDNYIRGKDYRYPRGDWSWDGTKPIFSFTKTAKKETTGYVNDNDTSWDVVTDKKKVMGLGASGPLVKHLQSWLIGIGYADGLTITQDMEGCKENQEKCDGIYGKGTRDAVIKAQEAFEIDNDGVVGTESYEAFF